MNSSQQSLATIYSSAYELGNDAGRWPIEDDIPLGCECANPALQIERWGQESELSGAGALLSRIS